MKKFYKAICFFAAITTAKAAVIKVDFNITMNTQPQSQQIMFSGWSTGLFVVDYFANGSLSFAGKNNNDFQTSICVKPIGGGNYAPINIYNNSSVKDAGSEWRTTPVFMHQPSISFENEFLGKGNSYLGAKMFIKATSQTLYFWFLVNLSADGKTFQIIKAAYDDNEEDILTENEGIVRPTTSIQPIFNPTLLQVYPNPATNNIQIDYPGDFKYEIVNITGKTIVSDIGSNSKQIPINNLPRGVYFITVQNKQTVISQKIVLE